MATLAQILHWGSREGTIGGAQAEEWIGTEPVQTAKMGAGERASADPYLLRPLPNEDVYLYVKRFDNTRVVRQADPQVGRTAWTAIGASCLAAGLLVCLLLPGAYRLLAGYQIDSLQRSREQSMKELKTLEFEEARRLNLDRMREMADGNDFVAASAAQVEYIQSKDSLAHLKKTAE
jgi:hypothetical protein